MLPRWALREVCVCILDLVVAVLTHVRGTLPVYVFLLGLGNPNTEGREKGGRH